MRGLMGEGERGGAAENTGPGGWCRTGHTGCAMTLYARPATRAPFLLGPDFLVVASLLAFPRFLDSAGCFPLPLIPQGLSPVGAALRSPSVALAALLKLGHPGHLA